MDFAVILIYSDNLLVDYFALYYTPTCGEKVNFPKKCNQWLILEDKSYLPASTRLFLIEEAIACLDPF